MRSKNGCGYIMVDSNGSSHSWNGMMYEHVQVAEAKLGRELRQGEVVHHINFKKDDNRSENIIVFASKEDHTRYHNVLNGKIPYGHYKTYIDDEGVYHCIGIDWYCKYCGCKVTSGNDICIRCSRKHKDCTFLLKDGTRVTRKPIIVERGVLKTLIREHSFVEIGRMYGVSDNAVRNWCKRYNLPRKKSEIEKYNDDEWDRI